MQKPGRWCIVHKSPVRGANARVAQWWSIALPRRGSRVRIPSRASKSFIFSLTEPGQRVNIKGALAKGNGEVSEWFKELVLKTSDSERGRGFESHLLRLENKRIRNRFSTLEKYPSWPKGLPWKGSRSLIAAQGFKSLLLRLAKATAP